MASSEHPRKHVAMTSPESPERGRQDAETSTPQNISETKKLDALINQFEKELNRKERRITPAQKQFFREKLFDKKDHASLSHLFNPIKASDTNTSVDQSESATRERREMIGLFPLDKDYLGDQNPSQSRTLTSLSMEALPTTEKNTAPGSVGSPRLSIGRRTRSVTERSASVASDGTVCSSIPEGEPPVFSSPKVTPKGAPPGAWSPWSAAQAQAKRCQRSVRMSESSTSPTDCPIPHPTYMRTVSDTAAILKSPKKEPVTGRSRSVTFSTDSEKSKKHRLKRTPTPYWDRRELIHEETIYGEDYDIQYNTGCDDVGMTSRDDDTSLQEGCCSESSSLNNRDTTPCQRPSTPGVDKPGSQGSSTSSP